MANIQNIHLGIQGAGILIARTVETGHIVAPRIKQISRRLPSIPGISRLRGPIHSFAESVLELLEKPGRFRHNNTIPDGQTKPVAENNSPLGRAHNRRVELTKQYLRGLRAWPNE